MTWSRQILIFIMKLKLGEIVFVLLRTNFWYVMFGKGATTLALALLVNFLELTHTGICKCHFKFIHLFENKNFRFCLYPYFLL